MDRYNDRGPSSPRKQPVVAGQKVAGPGSASLKYDFLTALLTLSAQTEGTPSRLAVRLSLIVTARFNWRLGYFAVGQRELARMWGVSERTAKREIAHMRSFGWISVDKPAARGRVAQHRINFETVLRDTMPYWDAVGPDFTARMTQQGSETSQRDESNVVPLHAHIETKPPQDGSLWAEVAERLYQQDTALFAAWFAKLVEVDVEGGILTLAAPNAFVADYVRTHHQTRLLAAAVAQTPLVRSVQVICETRL
ncbi:DnaA N-terminal domain-containing protein [Planktotalea sp.]|uniref:DnaA N-terminal domain-containing protein n=1 Tax=Planktotalea sp. TaxID=2029877 RepID=UPI0032981A26